MTLLLLAPAWLLSTVLLVLVVVIAMDGVAVPVMGVVHMAAVGNGLMSAAGPMSVGMPGVSQVRQRMLVVMVVMHGVGVAFVDVVDVTLTLGAGMPAAGSVLVGMRGMNGVLGGHHGSSLL
jgi:hypothetical protein